MARHHAQDSTVRDYTAKLRYRVSFGFARRKWGDPLPVAVEEQDATHRLAASQRPAGRHARAGAARASCRASTWRRPSRIPGSCRARWVIRCGSSARARRRIARRRIRWRPGPTGSIATPRATRSSSRRRARRITDAEPSPSRRSSPTARMSPADSGSMSPPAMWCASPSALSARELWGRPEGNTPRDSADARREGRVRLAASRTERRSRILAAGQPLLDAVSPGDLPARSRCRLASTSRCRSRRRRRSTTTRSISGTRVVFDAPFPRDSTARGRNRGTARSPARSWQAPAVAMLRADAPIRCARGRRFVARGR